MSTATNAPPAAAHSGARAAHKLEFERNKLHKRLCRQVG
jgi:hypothetical protein